MSGHRPVATPYKARRHPRRCYTPSSVLIISHTTAANNTTKCVCPDFFIRIIASDVFIVATIIIVVADDANGERILDHR